MVSMVSWADRLQAARPAADAVRRRELDLTAQRRIAVLDPVKLIVDNYPEDKTEYFDVANNPNREANDTTTRKSLCGCRGRSLRAGGCRACPAGRPDRRQRGGGTGQAPELSFTTKRKRPLRL